MAESLPSAEKDRPYCLRCEVPIYRDDHGVWRREATGSQVCPRNPAVDGHEPMIALTVQPGTEHVSVLGMVESLARVTPPGHGVEDVDDFLTAYDSQPGIDTTVLPPGV